MTYDSFCSYLASDRTDGNGFAGMVGESPVQIPKEK